MLTVKFVLSIKLKMDCILFKNNLSVFHYSIFAASVQTLNIFIYFQKLAEFPICSIVTCQPAVQIGLFKFVTFNAESHFKSFSRNSIQGFDLSMAFLTFDFLFNMPLMVEQNVFRNVEDFFPGCRRPGVKIFMFLLNPWVIGDDVLVTVQAFFNRGDSRMNRPFDIRMAELALDRLDTGMDPVAEGNRLQRSDPLRQIEIIKVEHDRTGGESRQPQPR